MAQTNAIAIIVSAKILLCLILIALYIWQVSKWQRRAYAAERAALTWRGLVDERANIANQWMTATRLLAIHRDGRALNITFARGEKTFILEAMATWDTDLPGLERFRNEP